MTAISRIPPESARAEVAAWVRSIRAYYAPCTRRVLVSGAMIHGADLMAHRFCVAPDTWRGWERGDAIPRARDIERLINVARGMHEPAPRQLILAMVHDARLEQSCQFVFDGNDAIQ